MVQPDVIWIGPESRCQAVGDQYWHGTPDLVVEVLSPSTAVRDRGYKFDLYERHGVREYWLVEPEGRFLEVYVLEDGRFVRRGLYQEVDDFTSPVLGGQTIVLKDIFPPRQEAAAEQ